MIGSKEEENLLLHAYVAAAAAGEAREGT